MSGIDLILIGGIMGLIVAMLLLNNNRTSSAGTVIIPDYPVERSRGCGGVLLFLVVIVGATLVLVTIR